MLLLFVMLGNKSQALYTLGKHFVTALYSSLTSFYFLLLSLGVTRMPKLSLNLYAACLSLGRLILTYQALRWFSDRNLALVRRGMSRAVEEERGGGSN